MEHMKDLSQVISHYSHSLELILECRPASQLQWDDLGTHSVPPLALLDLDRAIYHHYYTSYLISYAPSLFVYFPISLLPNVPLRCDELGITSMSFFYISVTRYLEYISQKLHLYYKLTSLSLLLFHCPPCAGRFRLV